MRQPSTNICPLNGGECMRERCEWSCGLYECALVKLAYSLDEIADSLDTLVRELAQTKKTAPSAANAESGKKTRQDT